MVEGLLLKSLLFSMEISIDIFIIIKIELLIVRDSKYHFRAYSLIDLSLDYFLIQL